MKVKKKLVSLKCTFDIPNDVIALTFPLFQIVWYKGDTALSSKFKSTFTNKTQSTIRMWDDFLPGDEVGEFFYGSMDHNY